MTSRCDNPECARLYVRTRHAKQRYCSLRCAGTAKLVPRVVAECPVCHVLFRKKASSRQVHCGYECQATARGREAGAHLVRCDGCHSLFDRPHECPGDVRETYGFSAIALAEVWA